MSSRHKSDNSWLSSLSLIGWGNNSENVLSLCCFYALILSNLKPTAIIPVFVYFSFLDVIAFVDLGYESWSVSQFDKAFSACNHC